MANEHVIIIVESVLEFRVVFDAFRMEPVLAEEAVDENCVGVRRVASLAPTEDIVEIMVVFVENVGLRFYGLAFVETTLANRGRKCGTVASKLSPCEEFYNRIMAKVTF